MAVGPAGATLAFVVLALARSFMGWHELNQDALPQHREDERTGDPNGQSCKETSPHERHSPNTRGRRAFMQGEGYGR